MSILDIYSYLEDHISPEDFYSRVEEIAHRYEHLIDDVTAGVILSRLLDIELPPFFIIQTSMPGMKGIMPVEIVSLKGPIEYINQKTSEKGLMYNATIATGATSGKLSIWSRRIVDTIMNGYISEGEYYIVHGIRCTGVNPYEFRLEKGAHFTRIEEKDYESIIEILLSLSEKKEITSVEDIFSLSEEEYEDVRVNIEGVVTEKDSYKEFEKNGRIIKLQKIVLHDGTGECEVVGWGNVAEVLSGVETGQKITIVDGIIKKDSYSKSGINITLTSRSLLKIE